MTAVSRLMPAKFLSLVALMTVSAKGQPTVDDASYVCSEDNYYRDVAAYQRKVIMNKLVALEAAVKSNQPPSPLSSVNAQVEALKCKHAFFIRSSAY